MVPSHGTIDPSPFGLGINGGAGTGVETLGVESGRVEARGAVGLAVVIAGAEVVAGGSCDCSVPHAAPVNATTTENPAMRIVFVCTFSR